jgi:hypothetical protein
VEGAGGASGREGRGILPLPGVFSPYFLAAKTAINKLQDEFQQTLDEKEATINTLQGQLLAKEAVQEMAAGEGGLGEGGGVKGAGAARGQEGRGTLPFAARITPRCSAMRAFYNVRIPQLQYDR